MEEKVKDHAHPVNPESIIRGRLLGEDDPVNKGDYFPDKNGWVRTTGDGLSPKEMGDKDPWVRPV